MKPLCPRCIVSGRPGTSWKATGRFSVSRHGRRQAQLQCEDARCSCYTWMCGLSEAIDAANAERGETDEPLPIDSPAPQPSLPATRVPPTSQPTVQRPKAFTTVGELAQDFKSRQSGEDVA
jgi:hypothetical protein